MSIEQYKIIHGKFVIYKIPMSNIQKCNVSLTNNDKTHSLSWHAQQNNWDIAVNGAMFDMNTYRNVTDLIIGGKLDNGGNYSDVGIAFGNDFPTIGAYRSKTPYSTGKAVDFIGGAPTLLVDGEIVLDMKGIQQSFATVSAQRTAVGVDRTNLYLLSTLGNKANLNEVAKALQANGCTDAINLDGGGSTALYADGKVQYSGRNIPSALGVKLKQSPSPTKQPYVILDAGHCELTAGKRSPDGTFREYEFNYDVSCRIKKILERHGVKADVQVVNSANDSYELNTRASQANTSNADILVSIHANAAGSDGKWYNAKYWCVFCYSLSPSTNGYKLASHIKNETAKLGDVQVKEVLDGSKFAMIRLPKMPAVLIEHCFYDNKEWCERLKTSEWRDKFALADAKGILAYFGITYTEEQKEDTATPPPPTELYTVQVGAFSVKENAEKLLTKLKEDGYQAYITKK